MGRVISGGENRPISTEEVVASQAMRDDLARFSAPVLQNAADRHEHLYFSFIDGTGEDLNNPKLGAPTNVGTLYLQAKYQEAVEGSRVGAFYSKGIGTQPTALGRAIDGALCRTWPDAIEAAYLALARKTRAWKDSDPDANVRVAAMGYSRGAVQSVGFQRLIETYGIAAPEKLKFGRDPLGNITVISKYLPLIPPGQVAQASLLLDPVATGFPEHYDARLPPSVISAISITAANEQRRFFPHQTINDPGMSADGRAINVKAPGGHSDIGGGNEKPGLEICLGNVAADYLNLLRDEPMFQKRPVPTDASTLTVHQARGATALWGAALDHDGQRNLRDELAHCKVVDPCRDSEALNLDMARQFDYRPMRQDPEERAQLQILLEQTQHAEARTSDPARVPAAAPLTDAQADALVEQYFAAVAANDREGMRAASIVFAHFEADRTPRSSPATPPAAPHHDSRRDHPLFTQAIEQLQELGPATGGYGNREALERIAGAIALEAQHRRMEAIDEIITGRDGVLAARWTNPLNRVLISYAVVDPQQAVTQPLDRTLQQLEDVTQQQFQLQLRHDEQRSFAPQPAVSR